VALCTASCIPSRYYTSFAMSMECMQTNAKQGAGQVKKRSSQCIDRFGRQITSQRRLLAPVATVPVQTHWHTVLLQWRRVSCVPREDYFTGAYASEQRTSYFPAYMHVTDMEASVQLHADPLYPDGKYCGPHNSQF
jgi:hypothetical protein